MASIGTATEDRPADWPVPTNEAWLDPVPEVLVGLPSMATYHLAQLNVGRLVQPLDHPDMAEFTEALGGFLKRRTNRFEPTNDVVTVCWWTPAGVIPPLDEAYHRLLGLRVDGVSEAGWPMSAPMPPPQE